VMEHGFLKQREMAKILAVVYVHCQDNMQIWPKINKVKE
jgi:hypothetical protein